MVDFDITLGMNWLHSGYALVNYRASIVWISGQTSWSYNLRVVVQRL